MSKSQFHSSIRPSSLPPSPAGFAGRQASPPAGSLEGEREGEVTRLLRVWQDESLDGTSAALEPLLEAVVGDLRRMAERSFARERAGHTLQPTALVGEVCIRLLRERVGRLEDREAFFAFAARLMRQILVDHARKRKRLRRGGDSKPLSLDEVAEPVAEFPVEPAELLALDQALDRLGALDRQQRAIAELRFFCGLSMPQIAEALDLSLATVERRWSVARRWLARELS